MIIAIDGPAGSGKSTTARSVAARLGYIYIDTGAMYRAVGLWFIRNGIDPQTAGLDQATTCLEKLEIGVRLVEGVMHVYLNGEDVSGFIRTPEMSQTASQVSKLQPVREKLVQEQRRIAERETGEGRGIVMDGRDIGTVVFPDADLKVFMVADLAERARRRLLELEKAGATATLAEVEADIAARDHQDATRPLAPLRQAADAVVLDTSNLSIDAQVERILSFIEER